jgi:hypothetical protein
MNANRVTNAWNSLCPPAKLYPIVMAGVVLFYLYRETYRTALTHTIAAIIGTTLLWVLCAANLEFAAYAMLLLPVLFFVFLLALIFYDQSLFDIKRAYKPQCGGGCEEEDSCESSCGAY